jgi:hypothetical protein
MLEEKTRVRNQFDAISHNLNFLSQAEETSENDGDGKSVWLWQWRT